MCGLVAIYRQSQGRFDPNLLSKMTETLRHRGPDGFGYSFSNSRETVAWQDSPPKQLSCPGIAMGHRRLSIIDLSEGGHQPYVSDDGRLAMVYNGEVYNYIELRRELSQLGHRFLTTSDTEVVLAAFQRWGTECFSRFNGMWAIVMWDRKTGTLTASRDRLGVKPLYYHRAGEDLVFASEIKAILKHPQATCEPEEESVFYYLEQSIPPQAGKSFFRDINAIEPGTYMTVTRDRTTSHRYWSIPQPIEHPCTSLDDARDEFLELFSDSVKLRLRADVRVGTMLSGGLDSTSVIATLAEHLGNEGPERQAVGSSIQGFTAAFPGASIDESTKTDELCQTLNLTANKVFPMDLADPEAVLQQATYDLEMPFFNSVPVVHTLLMRLARDKGVKVVLNGHGADELFAGYPDRYCAITAADALRRWQIPRFVKELKGMSNVHGFGFHVSVVRILDELPVFRRSTTSHKPTSGFTRWFDVGGASLFRSELFHDALIRRYAPFDPYSTRRSMSNASYLDGALRRDATLNILPVWLEMEDRISMAASIESRLPFLDYRVVEFAFRLSNALKIDSGQTKVVIRHAMRNKLPGSIVNDARKTPFSGPDGHWLGTSLKPLTQKVLIDDRPRTQQFIKTQSLRALVAHVGVQAPNQTIPLWKLLSTELWMRRFFG